MTNIPTEYHIFKSNERLILGPEIGKGGEGSVYDMEGCPNRAVKIYSSHKVAERREDKIVSVIGSEFWKRSRYVAFPIEAVCDASDKIVGFTMAKFDNARPIHQLWDRRDRLEKFPKADVKFFARVATNAARLVASLHRYCVIGDINESSFLVNDVAEVFAIDSDSFQYANGADVFPCRVFKPEYRPPEHQGKDPNRLGALTTNHDSFGLAVILFQLLMFGQHPYSGVWRGTGEPPTLGRRIERFQYAFANGGRDNRPVAPQPTALPIQWLGNGILDGFDRAFGRQGLDRRMRAKEWIEVLEEFEKQLAPCKLNGFHYFRRGREPCPWCMTDERRPQPFFPDVGSQQRISQRQSGGDEGQRHRRPRKPTAKANGKESPRPVGKRRSLWFRLALLGAAVWILVYLFG